MKETAPKSSSEGLSIYFFLVVRAAQDLGALCLPDVLFPPLGELGRVQPAGRLPPEGTGEGVGRGAQRGARGGAAGGCQEQHHF